MGEEFKRWFPVSLEGMAEHIMCMCETCRGGGGACLSCMDHSQEIFVR